MSQPQSVLTQALARAQDCLARRDLNGAEQAIVSLGQAGPGGHPAALGMMGLIRLHQGRLPDAAALLANAHAAVPGDASIALNLGRAQMGLGQNGPAETAMRQALTAQPGWPEAQFELGLLLHRTGRLEEAESQFRAVLAAMPALVHARLALGAVLTDQGRPAESEALLRAALDQTTDANLKAQIQLQLAAALLRQRKDQAALAAAESAKTLQPAAPRIDLYRVEALQNLDRFDDALAIYRRLLSQAPGDPGLHHDYNALLYRLGRDDEFLLSYDSAPVTRPLLLGKAHFLALTGRADEAHDIYACLTERDRNDVVAALGLARTLTQMKRAPQASALFDTLLQRPDVSPGVLVQAAETALLAGDPLKAAHLCETGLARMPHNGAFLAILSTVWRLLDDERDETLCGYDTLVRAIDLDPPDGFSSMEDFNAELNLALDRLHPDTRAFLDQSLRGGTQTPDNLFGAGIDAVDKLKTKIDEAVARYIAELPPDDAHPFLSRRSGAISYAGAWSSRLKDRGFHVNHIHPRGWISSCYYVAVPPAVADGRQGWIKFGEPQLDVTLKNPVRRAIQPKAGRLVLFPSYLWHGTVPFHDAAARTTIAFDAVPKG